MQSYTTLLQAQIDDISPDDENFIDELLEVSKLFRTFSEGLDDFIVHHGYESDLKNTDGKAGKTEHAALWNTGDDVMRWWMGCDPKHEPDQMFMPLGEAG